MSSVRAYQGRFVCYPIGSRRDAPQYFGNREAPAPRVVPARLACSRTSRDLGPIYLSTPRSTVVGSLLIPVRDAAAFLAYEPHAPVLGDYDRQRSGQRTGQSIGRAVAGTHVPGLLFDDLLTF